MRLAPRVTIALVVAAIALMTFAVSLNITVTRAIARPAVREPTHTAFVIAIDAYPLEYGGEAYIVRYTLDGAYHAPDFRCHEDVGVFLEHLKKIAVVEGLLDV
jgi:hypothetical protein